MIERRLNPIVLRDLAKKMVMIAGPRQCGKTTLAKEVAKETGKTSRYYNWDINAHRKIILNGQLETDAYLWILDELHKYRHWKNFLKGLYDEHHEKHLFLITGSARLSAYSRGGDSLQGRYYLHRLHPFTFAEILGGKKDSAPDSILRCESSIPTSAIKTLNDLLTLGGFPEPFLSGSEKEANRWRLSYDSHLVREDVRDLESIQDLDKMELLLSQLPATVGSVLSINSLRENLEVAFETVRHWLLILENIYAVFRLPPFGAPRIKAVKKEQKLYFWDWGKVAEAGARLENLVAMHLLRFTHYQQDVQGENFELRYFRDVNGHEVDFILTRGGKPWCAVEVKHREQSIDKNLKYLLERVTIPHAFQVHLDGKKDWEPKKINGCRIRVLPATRFLGNLV